MTQSAFFSTCCLILLTACASAPKKPPAPELSADQYGALAEAERAYRTSDEEFVPRREALTADPVTAYWLTRFLVRDVVLLNDRKRADDTEFLVAVVRGGEDPDLQRALGHLRTLGAAAAPALVDLLRGEASDRQRLVSDILGYVGDPAVPGLQPLMQDSDWRMRRLAVSALAGMPDSEVRDGALLQATRDPQFAVRAEAWEALLASGTQHRQAAAQVLATERDPFVRRVVAKALGAHPDRVVAGALIDYLARALAAGDRRGVDAAHASLQAISGHQRSVDVSFWRAWHASWSPEEG